MLYDLSCIQFLPDASSVRYKKSHATKLYRLNCPFLNMFPQRSGWSPAPAGFAPSIDWQMQQTADFADIRQVPHHLLTIVKKSSYIVDAQDSNNFPNISEVHV